MGQFRRSAVTAAFLFAGILMPVTRVSAGPGFGLIRTKKLDLPTREAALIRLANTSIAFKASATNPQYSPVEGSLIATLETELLSNERTLTKKENPAEAEWVLHLKITGYSVAAPQQRTEMQGKNPVTLVHWNGSLTVAYEVLDHNGRVHDANNVNYSYDKEFNGNQSTSSKSKIPIPLPGRKASNEVVPHSAEDVKQILVTEVVHQIATKLGNTTKIVEMQIAGGEEHLNRSAEFLERKLWSRSLDELEKMTPFAKPEDEAYRQYDLGLTYEGMGYEAKTSSDQRTNLFKAAELYDKALEMNPKEKYFVDTVARLKDAIARYKALDLMQQEDQKKRTASPPRSPSPEMTRPVLGSTPTAAAPSGKTLTVADVVEMYAAGVPSEQIVDMIRSSQLQYDYQDKDAAIAIAKAKLPVSMQNEMRKRIGAPLLNTGAPSKAPATKKQL